QGNITVTVAKRLSNGNLVVRGQKWIEINQGREFVRIQGVIRPLDIQPDNTIASYKVADASIAYGARGALADANRPGLLSRFFNPICSPPWCTGAWSDSSPPPPARRCWRRPCRPNA